MRATTLDVALNTVMLASLVYFAVDAWLGPSGASHWPALRSEISVKKAEVERLERRAAALEAKIQRLTGPNVDRELLDERLRAAYGLGRRDDALLAPLPEGGAGR